MAFKPTPEEEVYLAILSIILVMGPPGPLASADIRKDLETKRPEFAAYVRELVFGEKATITTPADETFTLESKRATQAILRKVMS